MATICDANASLGMIIAEIFLDGLRIECVGCFKTSNFLVHGLGLSWNIRDGVVCSIPCTAADLM